MFIRKIKYKGGLLSMKDNAEMRKEHNAVREKVGYHDFTHELLEARGADVGAFMDKMFVNDISGADVGQGVYKTMLIEEGKIIDDLIIFCVNEYKYYLTPLYIDLLKTSFTTHYVGFYAGY